MITILTLTLTKCNVAAKKMLPSRPVRANKPMIGGTSVSYHDYGDPVTFDMKKV